MKENASNQLSPKIFKSASIQLIAAILTEISEATFLGFEDDPTESGRKLIIISYPDIRETELNKMVREFGQKILNINLFYYNRNLNFLRDRIFNRRAER